jgi:hypothetical protein
LRKLPRPCLFCLEQARVLDGDDGSVRKDLKQRDLFVTEQPDLGASNGDHPDGFTRVD